jgi:hypothetical protein
VSNLDGIDSSFEINVNLHTYIDSSLVATCFFYFRNIHDIGAVNEILITELLDTMF